MDNLGSELNKFFDKYSLPTVKKLLGVPDDLPIGTVSPQEMEAVWEIAHKDMGKIIDMFKKGDVDNAAEVTVKDVVKIAEVYGVPGTNVAATIVPYVFAEMKGEGKVDTPVFLQALKKSEAHMEIIKKNLKEGKFKEASRISLTDMFDAAEVSGGGVYASIIKLTVLIGFGIAEEGSLQDFIMKIVKILATIANTITSIFPTQPQTINNKDGSTYVWDSIDGWVYVPNPHNITRGKR